MRISIADWLPLSGGRAVSLEGETYSSVAERTVWAGGQPWQA